MNLHEFINKKFGVDEELFLNALKINPSSQGYILGAISELVLKKYLMEKGYEVLRIKEKPSGGNKAKSKEARGDFYIRKKESKQDAWFVLESKGLKSNSEFRGSKLDSKEKVFRFLKNIAFPPKDNLRRIFQKGRKRYLREKKAWSAKNKGKRFPPFKWKKNIPGPNSANLSRIWKNEEDLQRWISRQPIDSFKESAYREVRGPIVVIETHSPSKREALVTGIQQAAPLVMDFNMMAVDLFLRTGKHEFAFMNAEEISHSPTSPEHLYQNYIIDILVKDKKEDVVLVPPWYKDIDDCIGKTCPTPRRLDRSQLDSRN